MDIEKELLKEQHNNQDNQLDDRSDKPIERDPASIKKYYVDAHGNVITDYRYALESNNANRHNK